MKKFFVYFFMYLFMFIFLESGIFVYLQDNKTRAKDEYLEKELKLFQTQYTTLLDSIYKNLRYNIEQKITLFENFDKNSNMEEMKQVSSIVKISDILVSSKKDDILPIDKSLSDRAILIKKFNMGSIWLEYQKNFKGYKYRFIIDSNLNKEIDIEIFVNFNEFQNLFNDTYNKNIVTLLNKEYYLTGKYSFLSQYSIDSDEVFEELSNLILDYRAKQLLNQNRFFSTFLPIDERDNLTFLFLPIKNDTKSNIGYLISRVKNSILSEFEYQFKVNFIVSTLFVIFFILAFILFNRSRVQTLQQKAILEQRFQKSSEELKLLDDYKKAVDISNVVSKSDIEGNITYVNDRFCEISGYTKEELIGKNFRILRHEETPIEVFKDLWDTILNKKVWKGIVKNKKKNGDFYVVDVTIIPILDKKLNIQEFMTIRSDITELIIKEEKIKNQTTDSLTLLPNRVKLLEDIENSNLPSISIVNIDSFSEINDLYGSEVGDMVLIELGNILSELASIYNLNVYKLNADEFGVFIGVELNNFEQIFRDFADNLISKLNKKPFVYKEQEIHFTVTLGIATGKDRLIIKANKAYREAKIQKRHYAFYSENLINKSANNNLKWLRELKFAFERDNIKAYFQPIINNHTGKIEKYESLVRLVDSKNEVKSPYFFLDVAKKSKLYPKITQKMIELAIETFRDKPYEFSINLSVEDILNSETIDFFKSKLQDRELAKKVVLEIVESEGIENFTEVADFINEMKELGCKIAIDDFGTGYSNFQYLASLNVDLIKIDGSLIKNIDNDKTLEIITKTIIDFARELNIKTVAEFVHSQSVLDKVKELKIDYSQGFFLGEPSDKI